jgi:hypothetical protein
MMNAGAFCPVREEDASDIDLPYFKISKTQSKLYNITTHNYEHHDNAPRMEFVMQYLAANVFPNVKADLSGCYPIQLHDSYTHVGTGEEVECLTFAKNKLHKRPILLPDPYMMGAYGGRLNALDSISFDKKESRIGFCGVSTGRQDPTKNQRLKLCEWGASNIDICDFKLAGIVQMDASKVVESCPNLNQYLVGRWTSPMELYNYKYLFSIDGNTACYDRPAWIMNSRSLLMKYRSADILWYYPFMMENEHFLQVDSMDDIRNKFMYAENNPQHVHRIIDNANQFVSSYLRSRTTAILYTTHLFEAIAGNKA